MNYNRNLLYIISIIYGLKIKVCNGQSQVTRFAALVHRPFIAPYFDGTTSIDIDTSICKVSEIEFKDIDEYFKTSFYVEIILHLMK